ncbi:MAG TPA: hypothetical protein VE086_02610 [Chthoniobacterales bacterium]|nr:hypothetical protein [Chthoniobacterales bacterium]
MFVRFSLARVTAMPRKRIDFALQNTHGDSSSNNSVFRSTEIGDFTIRSRWLQDAKPASRQAETIGMHLAVDIE